VGQVGSLFEESAERSVLVAHVRLAKALLGQQLIYHHPVASLGHALLIRADDKPRRAPAGTVVRFASVTR